ncbi:mRNA-capping enzyme subunit beta [Rhizophlyctis rosea]|uniref:mRNA-capping enzyme subunit beta n=1 Tax=Rhizophlyctis rosea TaxID=64517 RepID=A0AAD5SLV1_9FUNG|nr:mRNA-capping enzyme subunit beta [Rhizophlyctis rosea]
MDSPTEEPSRKRQRTEAEDTDDDPFNLDLDLSPTTEDPPSADAPPANSDDSLLDKAWEHMKACKEEAKSTSHAAPAAYPPSSKPDYAKYGGGSTSQQRPSSLRRSSSQSDPRIPQRDNHQQHQDYPTYPGSSQSRAPSYVTASQSSYATASQSQSQSGEWSPYGAPAPAGRMDPSMWWRRFDYDVVYRVAEFLRRSIDRALEDPLLKSGRAAEIEIEGKLGLILDKQTFSRVRTGSKSVAVMGMDKNVTRFNADMTMQQHQHFNRLLNGLVTQNEGKTRYKHTKETDHTHQEGNAKVRATWTKDQFVKAIQKKRIDDLEVHMPNHHLDFRISVNVEAEVSRPAKETRQHSRFKDRMSYTHEAFRVDLTQVKETDKHGQESPHPKHELEIEFLQMPELLEEKRKWDGTGNPQVDTASSSE